MTSSRYPKASPMGGTIIREVIANFKAHHFSLPIKEPILIAVSGGVDSMVLAHLLIRYGRKVIDPKLITLIHFDHQWRKASGTKERAAVKALAKKLSVQFLPIDLDPPGLKINKEKDARTKRNAVYSDLTKSKFSYVFTAHHQDDVVETLIWRFFRGEFLTHQKGILFQDRKVLRPFLQVTKEEIRTYAKLEKVPHHEDPTNQDEDQMRAQLRKAIIPKLEKLFPGLKRSLARYARTAS